MIKPYLEFLKKSDKHWYVFKYDQKLYYLICDKKLNCNFNSFTYNK